jgi:hypothetical protein
MGWMNGIIFWDDPNARTNLNNKEKGKQCQCLSFCSAEIKPKGWLCLHTAKEKILLATDGSHIRYVLFIPLFAQSEIEFLEKDQHNLYEKSPTRGLINRHISESIIVLRRQLFFL